MMQHTYITILQPLQVQPVLASILSLSIVGFLSNS